MVRDRAFTYSGQIKVSRSDFRLARIGKKTCTIRLGTASVAADEIDLTDGAERLTVKIVHVDRNRRYDSITETEARADGARDLAHLDADLRRFYGPLDPEQPMTVIHFRPLSTEGSSATDQLELWG